MDKAGLRNHFLKIRSKLSKKSVSVKSEQIIERLLDSKEFQKADTIHCYISIINNNEVHTHSFIKYCFEINKFVVVPKIKLNNELDHIRISSMDQLTKNSWGVLEPEYGTSVSPTVPDLIIVPMVTGDLYKNRLGYGKGFYDRFLSRTPAKKAGLLFDCQLFKGELPVEPFDIQMDFLVTESQRID